MATAALAFNPYVATVAAGSFNAQSDGFIAGNLLDHPTELFKIAGGVVAAAETIPMVGGIAITENIGGAAGTPDASLGSVIARATAVGNIDGFTVFNQAHHMVQAPQSPVPAAGSGNSINFVRKGSGARLIVACDPALVSLEGSEVTSNVSWDYNAQRLTPYDASTTTVTITTLTWAATNNGRLTVVTSAATIVGAVGDAVTISGATNSGTGGAAAINRTFLVDTFTDNQHFTLAAPAAAGYYGTLAGSPVVVEGTGILGLRVIGFNIGNSMVPLYDPTTGFWSWNRGGSTAILVL